ncbi:hypothetical protein C2845_PM05G13390 [Panicum miliaceum]|uniref:Uncharacterized protein n=1 Tax=Panicum miliaceum TaxID=4540 RepID=A0A3L6T035_PANMI|nr:hypothetical protein C2845_PM05G13390 [Panicum miliaceum]
MRPMRADLASLGARVRCEFERGEGDGVNAGRVKALEEGVRQALASAAFPETAYGCNYRSRRHRGRGFWSRIMHLVMNSASVIIMDGSSGDKLETNAVTFL